MQQWAADVILGVEDKDLLVSQLSIKSIPLNMATRNLIDFLEILENVLVEDCTPEMPCSVKKKEVEKEEQQKGEWYCLGCVVDQHISIINSSNWEPIHTRLKTSFGEAAAMGGRCA